MSSVSRYEFHGVKSTSSTFLLAHCQCDSVIRQSSSGDGKKDKKRRKRLELASADISSSRYTDFLSECRSGVKVRRSSRIETRKFRSLCVYCDTRVTERHRHARRP